MTRCTMRIQKIRKQGLLMMPFDVVDSQENPLSGSDLIVKTIVNY